MGACAASAPLLVVAPQGVWSKGLGCNGGLWGSKPAWSITFCSQAEVLMEVFMELSELSGIDTLNPPTPNYPDVEFHEGRGSSSLFSECRHCWAHKVSFAAGQEAWLSCESCGSTYPPRKELQNCGVSPAVGVSLKQLEYRERLACSLEVCLSVCLILLLLFLQSSKLPFCPRTIPLWQCQRRIPGAALLLCPPIRWCRGGGGRGGKGKERDSN